MSTETFVWIFAGLMALASVLVLMAMAYVIGGAEGLRAAVRLTRQGRTFPAFGRRWRVIEVTDDDRVQP